MKTASERVSLGVTNDIVEIRIDGETAYSGGVDELRIMLEQHKQFMDYIDCVEGEGDEQ